MSTQADSLYNAERISYLYKPEAKFYSVSDALRRLRDIESSSIYKALDIPPVQTILFTTDHPKWSACYRYHEEIVYMAPGGQCDLILLHELAHHMHRHKFKFLDNIVDSHGKRFAGLYRRLLYNFVSEEAGHELTASFVKYEVKYV